VGATPPDPHRGSALPLDPAEGLPSPKPPASFVPLRNKFLAMPLDITDVFQDYMNLLYQRMSSILCWVTRMAVQPIKIHTPTILKLSLLADPA